MKSRGRTKHCGYIHEFKYPYLYTYFEKKRDVPVLKKLYRKFVSFFTNKIY